MLRRSVHSVCRGCRVAMTEWHKAGYDRHTLNRLMTRASSSSSSHQQQTLQQQQRLQETVQQQQAVQQQEAVQEQQAVQQQQVMQHQQEPRGLQHGTHPRQLIKLSIKDVPKEVLERLPPVIQFIQDDRIIYSSYIDDRMPNVRSSHRNRLFDVYLNLDKKRVISSSQSLLLERLKGTQDESPADNTDNNEVREFLQSWEQTNMFPYSQYSKVEVQAEEGGEQESAILTEDQEIDYVTLNKITLEEDIVARLDQYDRGELEPLVIYTEPYKLPSLKLLGSELVDSSTDEGLEGEFDEQQEQFGTADPSVPVSKVPCGGCGALLHCQNPAIPGFKAREVFVGLSPPELRTSVCQRCHFLSNHNMALQVRVSPESYLDLLRPIKRRFALVLVLVDLTDAPCSIHPSIMDVIARGQPVIVVGNKVDLLPMDSKDCLERLERALTAVVRDTSLAGANIVDTCLVSGHTGFGIENLISAIHLSWKTQGDVYLVGSTNVGKSTLFNALLRSDLCKERASNVLLRATTSPWPGTTLNMLKFPMLRASGQRLVLRGRRLKEEELAFSQTLKYSDKYTKHRQLATLTAKVGRSRTSFETPNADLTIDAFEQTTQAPMKHELYKGINENKTEYKDSKWCYDTPGALQPDQFLSLLTHEELQEVVPSSMIKPETFELRPGQTLFIAGLVRLDIVDLHNSDQSFFPGSSDAENSRHEAEEHDSSQHIKATVFRSAKLPLTVVDSPNASSFYEQYIGSDLFSVPRGNELRMKHWSQLQPTDLSVMGVAGGVAAADVVLSSAGWVSLCLPRGVVCDVKAWTPGGRGAYMRGEPFLRYSVTERGQLKKGSIKYGPHKLFTAAHFNLEKRGKTSFSRLRDPQVSHENFGY